jgi:hypothetical protein
MNDDVTIAYYEDVLKTCRLNEAMCWTVVESIPFHEPLTIETVAERLGGDPGQIEDLSWDAAIEEYGQPVAHLVQLGSAVGVIENNGCESHHMMGSLSESGRVHSAFWNVNALSSLGCAALGHVLVSFEGLRPEDRYGLDVSVLDEELDPLYAADHELRNDAGDTNFRAVMMAIIEWRTGVRFEGEWLDTPLPAIRLSGQLNLRRVAQSGSFDPDLEAALWLAAPAALHAFTREMTEILVEAGDLTDEPEIPPVLERLALGVPLRDERYQILEQMAHRLSSEYEASSLTFPVRECRLWRRTQAASALHHALAPTLVHPLPLHSVQLTRVILGDQWLPARTRLRRHLRPRAR